MGCRLRRWNFCIRQSCPWLVPKPTLQPGSPSQKVTFNRGMFLHKIINHAWLGSQKLNTALSTTQIIIKRMSIRETICINHHSIEIYPADSIIPEGRLRIWTGWGCSSEILNQTPKGDRSGRGPSFFWPLKETMLKHRQYIYFLYFFACNPKRDLHG